MRILYVNTHLNTGGITSYILTLARGLKQRGHEVYVASSGGEHEAGLLRAGVAHIRIPINTKSEANFFKVVPSLAILLKVIRARDIDIIHANTRVTQVLACLASAFSGRPYVSTCHGFFKRRLSRRFLPCWGRRVIAISEPVKEHLVRDLAVPEAAIRVVHSGIDASRFGRGQEGASPDAIRASLGLRSSDSPVIGIIARLSDVKGHAYLLEALPPVLKEFPAARLLVVGEGRMKAGLMRLAKSLAIEENVLFVPTAPDTAAALSVMDVFVMPSLKEGLGLSLMEAMSSGCAAVGTDVGGIKSLIRDNETGLLAQPKDAAGLSRAILELLRDPQRRRALGEAGQDHIRKNFSDTKMIEETERVYEECVNVQA